MKLFLATFLALAVATQASLFDEWKSFKVSYGKDYSEDEDGTRFAIWEANRAMVEEHNAGDHSYWMALNEASLDRGGADQLEVRLQAARGLGGGGEDRLPACPQWSLPPGLQGVWPRHPGEEPGPVWQLLGMGQSVSLSEQQLVDCGVGSCQGGYMTNAFDDARQGIESESSYPYEGRDGSCRFNSNNQVAHCR